jgi:hypothetical protein
MLYSSESREAAMAVRDFKDEHDVVWKAWPVLATSIHPKTAAEDYLGDYSEGWLCFECSSGERRRLAKYPQDWDKLAEEQLRTLLKAATPVTGRKRTPPKSGDSINP